MVHGLMWQGTEIAPTSVFASRGFPPVGTLPVTADASAGVPLQSIWTDYLGFFPPQGEIRSQIIDFPLFCPQTDVGGEVVVISKDTMDVFWGS